MPDNVQLRPVADGDLPIFFEHQRDPQGVHMAAFTVPDPDDRAAFDDHWRWLRNNPTILMRTIAVNGQPAGHVSSYVGDVGLEVTWSPTGSAGSIGVGASPRPRCKPFC